MISKRRKILIIFAISAALIITLLLATVSLLEKAEKNRLVKEGRFILTPVSMDNRSSSKKASDDFHTDYDYPLTGDYFQDLYIITNGQDVTIKVNLDYYIDGAKQVNDFEPILFKTTNQDLVNFKFNYLSDELRMALTDGLDNTKSIYHLPEEINYRLLDEDYPLTISHDYKTLNNDKVSVDPNEEKIEFDSHQDILVLEITNIVNEVEYKLDIVLHIEGTK